MTIASALIQSAFREGNLIAPGKQPTTDEQTEALERLNRGVQGVFGFEMGENLADWQVPSPQRTSPIAANYPQMPFPTDNASGLFPLPFASDPTQAIWPYPPKNSRLVFGGVTNTYVYFPEAPDDGSRMAIIQGSGAGDSGVVGATVTLDGNGRTIETTATKQYTDPVTARQWLYRADLGDWRAVVDMALTDDCPFPSELDDLWICGLAIRLAPRYEKQVHPQTEAQYLLAMRKLKARYRQAMNTAYNSSDIPRTLQSYISGRWWW